MPARRLLPCVLGAALLTACGDTTDTTDTTEPLIDAPSTTLTTPPTQALELGEFDPEGDFQVFDPCTEIPAEVLEAAGLGESVGEPFYDGNRSAMCSFTAVDESRYPGVFSLVGDRNPRSRLEEQRLIIEGVDVEIPYGMPASRAARATASSPSWWNIRGAPIGESANGKGTRWPSTVVLVST